MKANLSELENIARELRLKSLTALYIARSGHPGTSLSAADIITYLYFKEMQQKDKFVLSKGHAVPILYAAFETLGWITKEELLSLRQINSPLQGHPDRTKMEYIHAGTGALGQGLSISIGFTEAAHLRKQDHRIYCLLGDGELQEGQVWEAAMYARARGLSNICAIVDCNGFQNETAVNDTLPLGKLKNKWKSFGWNVIEGDGHNFKFLERAFKKAKRNSGPTVILAQTIKGKGISFMENNNDWHGKVIDDKSFLKIKEELNGNY